MLYSSAYAQTLENVKWLTEEFPPYNYVENGIVKGISVDILLAVWTRVGLNKTPQDIQVLPWARGVRTLQSMPATCLFTTLMTAERRDVYGWKFVYPIPQVTETSNNHIIAKKSSNIKFNSIDDFKNYRGSFGVVRDDVGASLLVEAGVNVDRLDKTVTPASLIMKLHKGRHDIISYSLPATIVKMKEANIDPAEYEVIFTFPNRPLGFAFHHNINPQIIKKLQKALDSVHIDGTAEKILNKYVKH